jgi:hypothetical protein
MTVSVVGVHGIASGIAARRFHSASESLHARKSIDARAQRFAPSIGSITPWQGAGSPFLAPHARRQALDHASSGMSSVRITTQADTRITGQAPC